MEPVGLGVKVQQPFETIGNVMNIANTAQQMQQRSQQIQTGAVELEQRRQDLQERQALQGIARNMQQYINPQNGNVDFSRLLKDATVAAPKLGLGWAKDQAAGYLEGLNVKQAILNTDATARTQAGNVLLGVSKADPKIQDSIVNGLKRQYPELAPAFDFALKTAAQGDASNRSAIFETIGKAMQTAPVQSEIGTPGGAQIDTGQRVVPLNVKPFAGATGPIPGTTMQKELPPTTPTVTPSGQPSYVGPQPPTVPAGTGVSRPAAPVASAAPPTLASTVETVGKNFLEVQDQAKTAGQDIGVLQNIKKYAPGAITGVENDRRAYITGIAGLLGINAAQIGKTNTDLLIKNSNMQALGGNTDAARILLEGANPNAKMTKEAIVEAANQVISQRRWALEKQRVLGDVKAAVDKSTLPPAAYMETIAKLNTIDPRVFQLDEMSRAEKDKMYRSMTAAQREKFVEMLRTAKQMGLAR